MECRPVSIRDQPLLTKFVPRQSVLRKSFSARGPCHSGRLVRFSPGTTNTWLIRSCSWVIGFVAYPTAQIPMTEQPSLSEYLVISRGQWDETCSPREIQNAIDQFYIWLERLVNEGKMKRGQRLTLEGRTVARQNAITDGPFGESKEVIGGFWSVFAHNLDEAAQIAKDNPCLNCGLVLEIRPIDPQRATPENTRPS
jgi:hypothetical protein